MKKYTLYTILFAASLFMMSCQSDNGASSHDEASSGSGTPARQEQVFNPEGTLDITDSSGRVIQTVDIEIADNQYERERGLMYRQYMPEMGGMLFIFGREEYRSFWMKNTAISLDILYISTDLTILNIHKNTVPYSEGSVPSSEPAQYVLELNAGFCDIYGIREGMKIKFLRNVKGSGNIGE